MILKFVIMGVILIVGGVLFYPELTKLIPRDNSTFNAVAQNMGDLKDTTIKRVNYEVDKSTDTVGNKIDQIAPNVENMNPIKKIEEKIRPPPKQEVYYGQVYEKDEENNCKISVPKMAQTVNDVKELTHTITLSDCQYDKNQTVQLTVTNPTTNTQTSTNPTTNTQTIQVGQIPQTQIFKTLQLKTTRNADNIITIHYEDTSGKTLKVTVTLRNSEKQLFSGEFFTSQFDTSVNDVSTSPHIIEMIVEHAEYGTVTASVFNPQGNDNATIYGVFTK
jgi:hypothetical protein